MAIIEQAGYTLIGNHGSGFVALTMVQDRIDLAPVGQSSNVKTNVVKVTGTEMEAVKWGKDNKMPLELIRLVYSNHNKFSLIKTCRDLVLGAGLLFYQRKTDEKKKWAEPVEYAEGYDWLDEVRAYDVMAKVALSYYLSGQGYMGMQRKSDGAQIIGLTHYDFPTVRLERMKAGAASPAALLLHATWDRDVKGDTVTRVPLYDFAKEPDRQPRDFALVVKDGTPGNAYYDLPDWFGSQNHTLIANLISAFHLSGLKNGWNIRYLVEMPATYFARFEDKAEEMETKFKKELHDFLSGVENVNKALLTKFSIGEDGKPIQGFKITPVTSPGGDDMYLDLAKYADAAQASAHRLHPGLAFADTSGKLFGSGSELRIAYQLHLAMSTPRVRHLLTEPFNRIVARHNGWPKGVRLGFEDTNITTIADNPNGAEKVQNTAL